MTDCENADQQLSLLNWPVKVHSAWKSLQEHKTLANQLSSKQANSNVAWQNQPLNWATFLQSALG